MRKEFYLKKMLLFEFIVILSDMEILKPIRGKGLLTFEISSKVHLDILSLTSICKVENYFFLFDGMREKFFVEK